MAAIDKTFDYAVPEAFDAEVRIGVRVRVSLNGRRVGGWVAAEGRASSPTVALRAIAGVTGLGPDAGVLELSRWAAWRWAGRRATFLRTASPPTAVRTLPPPPTAARAAPGPDHASGDGTVAASMAGGVAVVRIAPATDVLPFVTAAAASAERGSVLVVAPYQVQADALAKRLRSASFPVALLPGEWAAAASGRHVVVGPRSAAWAPGPDLASAVVVDAHDEALQEERSPSWNASVVVAERCRRVGAPCALLSPCPTLELMALGRRVTPSRAAERDGWPATEIVDRRLADPREGLLSPGSPISSWGRARPIP